MLKKKKKISKIKKFLNVLNDWKETIAILISVGTLIYFITEYKVNLENEIKSKVTEDEVRTLIEIMNTDLKQDVKDIRDYILYNKIPINKSIK